MIRFTKMHGLGNDYVYVDAAQYPVDDPHALACRMADRHRGVGGDGLILVMPPAAGVDADVRMRMFNADGSESEMCGNGIRCVCKFAHDSNITRANPMRVQTGAGVLELAYELDAAGLVSRVRVDMGAPDLTPAGIGIALNGAERLVNHPLAGTFDGADDIVLRLREAGVEDRFTGVSMGNPHMVLYTETLADVPLPQIGPALERAPMFRNRINVHVVQVHRPEEVSMRTWERGSGITQACGTGAAAVCVAGVVSGRSARRVVAHLPGGDLDLEFDETSGHVFKTGPAVTAFEGSWPS